jgi:hypothetical protein
LRAKDLADIWIALRRFPPGSSLGAAIERYCPTTWWPILRRQDARAEARWARWCDNDDDRIPSSLDAVVAEVRHALEGYAPARRA